MRSTRWPMARKRNRGLLVGGDPVQDHRHDHVKRKNNPPAGLVPEGKVEKVPKQHYSYDPHLPPTLRFDSSGQAAGLVRLLEEAQRRVLSPEEVQRLADALRQREPWLEWAGKREQEPNGFDVETVPLH